MGVWIETWLPAAGAYAFGSHPVWVCGLKLGLNIDRLLIVIVTPCMGVWIETHANE